MLRFDGHLFRLVGDVQFTGPGQATAIAALIEYEDELYACGRFTATGASERLSIARWDGAAWLEVGGGVWGRPYPAFGAAPMARAMALWNGDLIVGGEFTRAGAGDGVLVRGLAVWNGSAWSMLTGGAAGVGDRVLALYA